jgi:serine/threonine-protein kinase
MDRAVRIVIRLCEALAYVHDQGVVHRDIKPGNIMICADGTLRILDFGLAITPAHKRVAPPGLAGTVGTAVYMAPEQVRGRRGDTRVDVYAVGCILYELTTGSRPYPLEDPEESAFARLTGDPAAPRQLNPEISAELEEIILRAVTRNPSQRYANCQALQQHLENPQAVFVSGLSGRLEPSRPYRPLRRLVVRWLLLSAIPLAIFGAMYMLSHKHQLAQ